MKDDTVSAFDVTLEHLSKRINKLGWFFATICSWISRLIHNKRVCFVHFYWQTHRKKWILKTLNQRTTNSWKLDTCAYLIKQVNPSTAKLPLHFNGILAKLELLHTPHPGQNGRHFADDIFRCIFVNETFCIFIKFSLKFVLKGQLTKNQCWFR